MAIYTVTTLATRTIASPTGRVSLREALALAECHGRLRRRHHRVRLDLSGTLSLDPGPALHQQTA